MIINHHCGHIDTGPLPVSSISSTVQSEMRSIVSVNEEEITVQASTSGSKTTLTFTFTQVHGKYSLVIQTPVWQ